MRESPVPILDLEECLSSDRGRREFVDSVRRAASDSGFLMCRAPDLRDDLVERMFGAVRVFAALELSRKMELCIPELAGERGYMPDGMEWHLRGTRADMKEAFSMGRGPVPHGGRLLAYPDNVWPEMPGFVDTQLDAYEWFDEVKTHLSRMFGLAAGADEDYFVSRTHNGDNLLRSIHYMPVPAQCAQELRSADHTDSNLFTILYGANVPGLQVLYKNRWIDVVAPQGHFVVNVGEMLERVTNGIFKSARHRVVVPQDIALREQSRFVFPYFVHPRKDVPLDVLPQCVSADNPQRWPSGTPAGVFLMAYLATTRMLDRQDPRKKFKELFNGQYDYEIDVLTKKLA